jgi:hypothetical protein
MIMAILFVFIACPFYAHVFLSSGNPDYTYYGVVPSRIYSYNLTDGDDRNSGWILNTGRSFSGGITRPANSNTSLVVICAAEDGTNVEVFDLTTGHSISVGHLDSMEKHFVLLANGTVFKVVSDKQVSVLLLNYRSIPNDTANEGPLPRGNYLSTDGMYVGKEFVLMASLPEGGGNNELNKIQYYTILALEKTEVTVTRDDGDSQDYSLEANSYKNILLSPFRVYKFESTGNIMLQSVMVPEYGTNDCVCFPVPSAEGGFVGTFFLARSIKGGWDWDNQRDYGYRIMAFEDTEVRVYDLETKQLMTKFTVTGGTGVAVKPSAYAIAVQSDKPVTLTFIHNGSIEVTPPSGIGAYTGYAVGVMFIGIQPNQETMIHLPVDAQVEAYFFANEETQLTIDDYTYTVHAGSPFFYNTLGTHAVLADHNVVLQINFWPSEPAFQGLCFPATIIPSVETVDLNPTVTLIPLGEGFPMMYVFVGAAGAAGAVIAAFLVLRRRGGKRS